VIFGVTLPAHRQFGICFACAFQDGWPPRYRLVSAQDDIDIQRVELEAAAASASAFGSDERRSRTEEWVEDDVAAFGHIEQRVFQHGNGLDRGVMLETYSIFLTYSGVVRIGLDGRAPVTVLGALVTVEVGSL